MTAHSRFVLNYKGIPYRTVWVEYPDIARTCQELGVDPTSTKADGSPQYTLPMIYDPSTKIALAESAAIALVREFNKKYEESDTDSMFALLTDDFKYDATPNPRVFNYADGFDKAQYRAYLDFTIPRKEYLHVCVLGPPLALQWR